MWTKSSLKSNSFSSRTFVLNWLRWDQLRCCVTEFEKQNKKGSMVLFIQLFSWYVAVLINKLWLSTNFFWFVMTSRFSVLKQTLLSLFENEIQWSHSHPMNSNDSNHLSINNTNATNNFSRLKSVRAKPQSFEGWKDNVINICKSDNVKRLQEGHKLWKIRKKTLVGISWYQRKFQLNLRWNQHFFLFYF